MNSQRELIIPPMGPAWFSSVMGTAILANLIGRKADDHPWFLPLATGLLLIGAILLVMFTATYITRWVWKTFHGNTHIRLLPVVDPAWGSVSMGYLAIGAALLAIGPRWGLSTFAIIGDTFLWWIGTFIGLVTNFSFLAHALFRHLGQPTPIWGLAVVGPMVSATTGAILLREYESVGLQFFMLTLSFLCFIIALVHGLIIFALAYGSVKRFQSLPLKDAISAWIPLGIVGQSTAAAVAISGSSGLFLRISIHPYATTTAIIYAIIMMILGVPMLAFAIHQTWRAVRNTIPFSPGWWALTFPVGTMSLGETTLSELPILQGSVLSSIAGTIGTSALIFLCFTWTLCASSSLVAVVAHHRHS
ncbi:Tellurite resistance protein TehA [Arcanobacterium phocae]|uniref:Tellurite resistance protein TehA n=1 Tax=Arcanobacterium phocae TaxID=131112 RepID=A0A1H2LFP4_9ACTO|nr:TDT family transporter [Arcanobacterium phocae]SDU79853.1 Tellurite resistance protein TehA [Arcanobacterium phocae]